LTLEQSRALVPLDVPTIVAMGTHPLVAFLANMQIQRDRAERVTAKSRVGGDAGGRDRRSGAAG
jgi:hypothetical protein